MKSTFNIQSSDSMPEIVKLAIEVSVDQISCLIYQSDPVKLCNLSVYQSESRFDIENSEQELKVLLETEQRLNRNFDAVQIFYNCPECMLVPVEYYLVENRSQMLDLQYGNSAGAVVFSDFLPAASMVNIFRVPAGLHQVLMQFFPNAVIGHASSANLLVEPKENNLLKCIFSHKQFKVFFYSNNRLQIHQYFNYSTPEDVAYHCLNICTQFQVPVDTCQLELSGFIEIDSNLYKTLHKYFLQIGFAESNEALHSDAAFANYQPHIFDHLTRMALCE